MSGPGLPSGGMTLTGPVQVTETAPAIDPLVRLVLWGNQPWPPGETVGTPVDVSALEWGHVRRLDEVLAYGTSGTYVVNRIDQAATQNLVAGPFLPVTRPLVGTALGGTEDVTPTVYIDGLPFGAANPEGWRQLASSGVGWGSGENPLDLRLYASLRARVVNPSRSTFPTPGLVMLIGSTPDLGQVEPARGAAAQEQDGARRVATAHVTQVSSDGAPQRLSVFDPAELGFGEPGQDSALVGPRSVVWEALLRLQEGTLTYRKGADLVPAQDDFTLGWNADRGEEIGARLVVTYLFSEQQAVISAENYADGITGPDGQRYGYFTPGALYSSDDQPLGDFAATERPRWTSDMSVVVGGLLWSPYVRLLAFAHPPGRTTAQDGGIGGYQGGVHSTTFEADVYTFGWSMRRLQPATRLDGAGVCVLPWPNWSYYGPGGRARDGTPWQPGMTP